MSAPERIYHVSQTQFSIARHYGAIDFNGHRYFYEPTTDTLIRDDIFKAEAKATKTETKCAKLSAQKPPIEAQFSDAQKELL